MRKLILILLSCSMAACATTETPQSLAAKTLLSSRQAVIAGATTTDALCKQKILSLGDCKKAEVLYKQAQTSYALASNAFVLAIQTGSSSDWKTYLLVEADYKTLAGSTVACYDSFRGGVK